MSSYTFRKSDSPSCLVVNKAWDDIVDKPNFFDTLVKIVTQMKSSAQDRLLDKSTPFRQVKEILQQVLIDPMLNPENEPVNTAPLPQRPNTILADAYWDEIIQNGETWEHLHEALERAYDMLQRIKQSQPLTASDDLQDLKDTANETILKPLNGINDDE